MDGDDEDDGEGREVAVPLQEALDTFLSDVHMDHVPEEGPRRQVSRFVVYDEPICPRHDTESTCAADCTSGEDREDDDNDIATGIPSRREQRKAVDAEGDLVVPRRPRDQSPKPVPTLVLNLQHAMSTVLDDVGLQLWRGGLLMLDWVAHIQSQLRGKRVLELGAGIGAVSIAAAHFGARVLCTDIGATVLRNCAANVTGHRAYFSPPGDIVVRELDWRTVAELLDQQRTACSGWGDSEARATSATEVQDTDALGTGALVQRGEHGSSMVAQPAGDEEPSRKRSKPRKHSDRQRVAAAQEHVRAGFSLPWSSADIDALRNCDVILAADVIYVEEWTEAFVACLRQLFRRTSASVCYLALEKRLCFSLDELDIACAAYTHSHRICFSNTSAFACRQIPLGDIPQHVPYQRIPQLELWEIRPTSTLKRE